MPDTVSIASGWDAVPLQRLIVRGINGKTVSALSLGIVPPGNKVFVPISALVGVQAPQSISSAPTVSIGTNSPNFDNLVAAVTLTGIANLQVWPLTLRSPFQMLTAGANVQLNISVAGASAGAITLTLVVLGFWS